MFRTISIAILVLVFTSACSSGGGGDSTASNSGNSSDSSGGSVANPSDLGGDGQSSSFDPANTQAFRVTTYNVGLLPAFVPSVDERVGQLSSALAAADTDVLCIQEAWRSGDQATLRSALAGAFPFVADAPFRQKLSSQVPACELDDFEPIASCLLAKCLLSNRDIVECGVRECVNEVETLAARNPECAAAVFAQIGRSSSEVFAIQDELLGSSQPAGLFAFDGSSGTLLFSKFPLANVQVLDFFDISTSSRRVAIFATIDINGVSHNVGCTHLTSNLENLLPYTGPLGSWEEEARAQAANLVEFAEAYANGNPVYLAGDFNCSIGNGQTGAGSDFSSVCDVILSNGYRDLAAEQIGCSFCSSNLLNQQNAAIAGNGDFLLDHVFTRNTVFAPDAVRLEFQQMVTSGNLSDHFGITLTTPVPGP